nr:MAG TPA: hypothetical protein [Caudoviricetes sp.]
MESVSFPFSSFICFFILFFIFFFLFRVYIYETRNDLSSEVITERGGE